MKAQFILYSIILFIALWTGAPCNAAGNKPPQPPKGKGNKGQRGFGRSPSFYDLPPGVFIDHVLKRGQRRIGQRLGLESEALRDVFQNPQSERNRTETDRLEGFTIGKPKETPEIHPELFTVTKEHQKNMNALVTAITGYMTIEKNPEMKNIMGYTRVEITLETKINFLEVIKSDPHIKKMMTDLAQYVQGVTFNWDIIFDPKIHHADPKFYMVRDILTIFRFVASPYPKNKQGDLPQLIQWAKTSSAIGPLMEVLYKVYELNVHYLRDLPPSIQQELLSLIDGRIREKLTPEERDLFNNIGKSSTLKEWEAWIARVQDKAAIYRIVEAFNSKLNLSESTKTTLTNFITDKIHPKITRRFILQQLTNNVENVSDKVLQTIVWYMESFTQYETAHGENNIKGYENILWEDLTQLINQAKPKPKKNQGSTFPTHKNQPTLNRELMNILHEIYGNIAGYIDLGKKTEKVLNQLEEGFPTIAKIRTALQRSKKRRSSNNRSTSLDNFLQWTTRRPTQRKNEGRIKQNTGVAPEILERELKTPEVKVDKGEDSRFGRQIQNLETTTRNESRAVLDSLETFINKNIPTVITEATKHNFLNALQNPNTKNTLTRLLNKIPGEEGNSTPVENTHILAKDILIIIRYAANSRSHTKPEDLDQMVFLAGMRNPAHTNIMDVLFEVHQPYIEPSTAAFRIISLLSRSPRIRKKLTPEEEALFENKGPHTSFKEWENVTRQIQNQKTEIEWIVETFDNRLHLSDETKTTLMNFIKNKVSTETIRIAEKSQQLADNIENISDKDLQTIIWYIKAYAQYETTHDKSKTTSHRNIAWDEGLNHLITLAGISSNGYRSWRIMFMYLIQTASTRGLSHDELMEVFHEIYGVAVGDNYIVLGEKAQQIKKLLQHWPPTIMEILNALQKTNPEETQLLADTLLSFIEDKSLLQKRQQLIEAIENFPYIRDMVVNLALNIRPTLYPNINPNSLLKNPVDDVQGVEYYPPEHLFKWSEPPEAPNPKSRVEHFINLITGPDFHRFHEETAELMSIKQDIEIQNNTN